MSLYTSKTINQLTRAYKATQQANTDKAVVNILLNTSIYNSKPSTKPRIIGSYKFR